MSGVIKKEVNYQGYQHRSSHRRCSVKKVFLNFLNFTEKHVLEFLLIKLQAWPATLLKRDSNTGLFL